MPLLSGETMSSPVYIRGTLADLAGGKHLIVNIHPNDPLWLSCRSNGFDVKFSDTNGTTALNFFRLRWNYTAQMAQFIVLLPASPSDHILVQWGHAAATDVSSAENTLKFPHIDDADTSDLWPLTEGSGTVYANSVAARPALNVVGSITRRDISDMGFARVPTRITSAGISWFGTCGYISNTTGYLRADAGYMDTPPASGSIHMWVFLGGGGFGTILSKYSDANNFLRVEFTNAHAIRVTKKNAGVTTSSFTSLNVNSWGSTFLLSIQWGTQGFEVLLSGVPIYRNPADTSAWGAGSGGRFTIGAYDNGTASDIIQDAIFTVITVHSRALTLGEIGYKCYHMRIPDNLSAQADKLEYYGVIIDGTGAGESGLVQEFTIMPRKIEGVWHAIWHGGVGYVCHGTGTDRLHWTRNAANPVLGSGVGGEAGPTLAVNGFQLGDELAVAYVNAFAVGSSLTVSASIGGTTWSTPKAILATAASGHWPQGFGNTDIGHDGLQWVIAVEGLTSGNQFQTGFARGGNLLSLTLDAETAGGGGFNTSSAPSACLTYGIGSLQPGVQSGGPFRWKDARGMTHIWFHGFTGQYQSTSNSIIYHRATWDGINFYESPTDIVLGVQAQVIATADQAADPCLDDDGGDGPTILYSEVFDNAGGASKIIAHTYDGALEEFVLDSHYTDSMVAADTFDSPLVYVTPTGSGTITATPDGDRIDFSIT